MAGVIMMRNALERRPGRAPSMPPEIGAACALASGEAESAMRNRPSQQGRRKW